MEQPRHGGNARVSAAANVALWRGLIRRTAICTRTQADTIWKCTTKSQNEQPKSIPRLQTCTECSTRAPTKSRLPVQSPPEDIHPPRSPDGQDARRSSMALDTYCFNPGSWHDPDWRHLYEDVGKITAKQSYLHTYWWKAQEVGATDRPLPTPDKRHIALLPLSTSAQHSLVTLYGIVHGHRKHQSRFTIGSPAMTTQGCQHKCQQLAMSRSPTPFASPSQATDCDFGSLGSLAHVSGVADPQLLSGDLWRGSRTAETIAACSHPACGKPWRVQGLSQRNDRWCGLS